MPCSYSFSPEIKTECIISLIGDIRSGVYVNQMGITIQKAAAILGSAAAMLPSGSQQIPLVMSAGIDPNGHDECSAVDMADELEALLSHPDYPAQNLSDCNAALSSAAAPVPVEKMNPVVLSLLVTLLQGLLGKFLGK